MRVRLLSLIGGVALAIYGFVGICRATSARIHDIRFVDQYFAANGRDTGIGRLGYIDKLKVAIEPDGSADVSVHGNGQDLHFTVSADNVLTEEWGEKPALLARLGTHQLEVIVPKSWKGAERVHGHGESAVEINEDLKLRPAERQNIRKDAYEHISTCLSLW